MQHTRPTESQREWKLRDTNHWHATCVAAQPRNDK